MEDFYMNNSSLDKSFNHTNITSGDYNYSNVITSYNESVDCILIFTINHVVTLTVVCIGLPLTLVAIYALYSLVQNDHVTPIYVINLLISDLIQLCCMIIELTRPKRGILCEALNDIYLCGLTSSVCFMVCVSMERYLVVTWPLWYRFRRTIRSSVVVCVAVWVLPLVCVLPVYFFVDVQIRKTVFAVFLLLPLPLFIFSLVGTLRALSASQIPSDEKWHIMGCLVLVMLIYMLLFLPTIIYLLENRITYDQTLRNLSSLFLKLSPLADLGLYVFMRKATIESLLAFVCRCRMDSDETNS